MAPPVEGVAGNIDTHFDDQLGFHHSDLQRLPAAPSGGERPARPRMLAPGWGEQAGDCAARLPGEEGGAADVLQPSIVVVPAEQQRAGSGQSAGDRADDRLRRLAHHW
jgi:hypothetical protein